MASSVVFHPYIYVFHYSLVFSFSTWNWKIFLLIHRPPGVLIANGRFVDNVRFGYRCADSNGVGLHCLSSDPDKKRRAEAS